MAKQDYYEILGVSKTAEEREIKKAYKRGHEISPGPQPVIKRLKPNLKKSKRMKS